MRAAAVRGQGPGAIGSRSALKLSAKSRMAMSLFRHYTCDVCGAFREEGQSWFLISENCWGDTVEILLWDPLLAAKLGVRHVCSPGHAHALMAQWMQSGCLARCRDPLAVGPEFGLPFWTDEGRRAAAARIGQLSFDHTAVLNDEATDRRTLMSVLDAIESVLQDHVCDEDYAREEEQEPSLVFDA